MGNPKAFMSIDRKEAGYRPVDERVCDFSEVEQTLNIEDRKLQASRCMDCGVPFCHWAVRWVTSSLNGRILPIKGNGYNHIKC